MATTIQSLQAGQGQKSPSPAANFNAYLQKHKDQLALALPKHLNADRMCRLSLTAFSQNKALADCDHRSIFGAVVLASQVGLEIGVMGQAYLVPYKGKATFVPGWQGLVDLVSRSGRATVWTGAVFEGDEFDYALGDSPFIKHRPCGEDDPSKLLYVYAVGRVNGSQWPVIEIWPMTRVLRHRDKNNKVGKAHYSYGNLEMYARKVPLLQVIKYMPKSVELSNALAADIAAETGRGVSIDGEFITLNDEGDEHPASASSQSDSPRPGDLKGPSLDDALFALKDGDIDGARAIAGELSSADRAIFDKAVQEARPVQQVPTQEQPQRTGRQRGMGFE